jgi:hypothetical protein
MFISKYYGVVVSIDVLGLFQEFQVSDWLIIDTPATVPQSTPTNACFRFFILSFTPGIFYDHNLEEAVEFTNRTCRMRNGIDRCTLVK